MHRRFMTHRFKLSGMMSLFTSLLISLTLISVVQAQPIPLPLDGGQSRATVDLLTNAGFEINTDGDKIPDGWNGKKTDLSKADKLKCNKDGKVFAHSGNCAFMFKGNADGTKSKLQQTLANPAAIVDGSSLTLSAYVDPKSAAPASKIAMAKVKLSDGSKIKVQLAIPANPASGYSLLTESAPVTIPNGVTITKALVDFRYGGTSGKFFVDDASLTVTTAFAPVKLTSNDGTAFNYFGRDVSISMDGTTVLVGAPYKDIEKNEAQGAAYIYTYSGGVWTQQQTLLASDGTESDYFGGRVDLSADGSTALIGTFKTIGGNAFQGAAYVFVREGNVWKEQQRLTASDGELGDYFASDLSLSADGNTVLIGVSNDTVGANADQGSAYLFTRSGGVWTQGPRLTASDGAAFDYLGNAVSLSADGKTALLGVGNAKIGDNTQQGAAYVYINNGGTWTQQAKLFIAGGEANDYFGNAVSLSADGNTALIGASRDMVGVNAEQGSAYVFTRSDATWTLQKQIVATDGTSGDAFGSAVSLSADGSTALIGAVEDNSDQGAAYAYQNNGGLWGMEKKVLAPDGAANDDFSASLSLNRNGTIAVIGAPFDQIDPKPEQGSAWVFDLE